MKKIILYSSITLGLLLNSAFAEDKYFTEFQTAIKAHLNIKNKLKNNKVIAPVSVAVIDSGISEENPIDQSFLTSRSIQGSNIVSKIDIYKAHGPHVHGIIYLLTKNKELKHYNYLKDFPESSQVDSLVTSLNDAINDEARIINLSLGGPDFNQNELVSIISGHRKGVIFVTAAGNEGSNIENIETEYFPASYLNQFNLNNLISVANFSRNQKIEGTSNFGKTVFIGAIGNDVPSYCPMESSVPCALSGTSMATPVITSAITLLLERYPFLSMRQIKYILSINSIKNQHTLKYTQVGLFDYNSFIGWLNKGYTAKDIFPKNKELQEVYAKNPNVNNTKQENILSFVKK